MLLKLRSVTTGLVSGRESAQRVSESGSRVRFSDLASIQTIPRSTIAKRSGRASVMASSVLSQNSYYLTHGNGNSNQEVLYSPNRRGILKCQPWQTKASVACCFIENLTCSFLSKWRSKPFSRIALSGSSIRIHSHPMRYIARGVTCIFAQYKNTTTI